MKKNGKVTPDKVFPNASTKYWWRCEKEHEWKAAPNVRVSGRGCPYCTGQRVLKGFNDLETLFPEIAEEWDYDENDGKSPSDYTGKSGIKVGWICEKNHKWRIAINNRTVKKLGCPYCAGLRPIIGETDLATLRPDLAEEWDYDKNGDKKLEEFLLQSNSKVWWRCKKCGYEYETIIANRHKGTGCPNCAGQIVHSGVNDLATLRPDLADEWDFDENGDITPNMIMPRSNKNYAWKCALGHKWIAQPNSRVRGTGCPYCSGNKVWVGFNDLCTTHPEIAKDWHPTKNGDLLPTMISKGCNTKLWWKCSECGNEYETYVSSIIKGFGCKICKRALKDDGIQMKMW